MQCESIHEEDFPTNGYVLYAASSPDYSSVALLLSLGTNSFLRLLFIKNSEVVHDSVVEGFKYGFNIAFSNDGQYLATSSIDKTLKVWDLYSSKLFKTFDFSDDWATKVIFINNTIICGTYKGKIIIHYLN